MASPPTKLPPNEFTRLIPKGRGPRRGARDPGAPVLNYVAQLWRLATVTPAGDPRTAARAKPSNANRAAATRQAERRSALYCPLDPWLLVPGPRA
jgi:hypothetical protein